MNFTSLGKKTLRIHTNDCALVVSPISSAISDLNIAILFKGLVSQTSNLIEDTPIAPHIAGHGELLVVDSLGGLST